MFWERFYALCLEHDTKPNPVGEKLEISSGAITKWKNGAAPSGDTLKKIARYFGVTTDYLLGETDSPHKLSNKRSIYDALLSRISLMFHSLSDADILKIVSYAEFVFFSAYNKLGVDDLLSKEASGELDTSSINETIAKYKADNAVPDLVETYNRSIENQLAAMRKLRESDKYADS